MWAKSTRWAIITAANRPLLRVPCGRSHFNRMTGRNDARKCRVYIHNTNFSGIVSSCLHRTDALSLRPSRLGDALRPARRKPHYRSPNLGRAVPISAGHYRHASSFPGSSSAGFLTTCTTGSIPRCAPWSSNGHALATITSGRNRELPRQQVRSDIDRILQSWER